MGFDNRISVIICCYNSDFNKLLNTLVSVLNQKNVCFDVVITDDGSMNKEFLQIKDWIETNKIQNVILNCNEENQGTIKNILSAIPFCKSNYVKLLSPGDYLYDEYALQHYVKTFYKEKCYIVTGKSVYYTKNYQIVPTFYPRLKQTLNLNFIVRNIIGYGDSILGASLAYEISFLKNNLNDINSKIIYAEDYPLISICLLENKKLSFCDKILVWYECDTGISTSKKISPLLLKDFENICYYLKDKFKDNKYVKYRFNREIKTKSWPKYLKLWLYPIVFPGYVWYKLKAKFTHHIIYEKNISKMHNITTLHKC